LGQEEALLSFPCGRYCRPMRLKTACGSQLPKSKPAPICLQLLA